MTYDRNITSWTPEDDDPILVKNLTISHLCNIINWILNHPNQYDCGILDFMIDEAQFRKLPAFVQNEPYIDVENVGYGSDARAKLVNVQ